MNSLRRPALATLIATLILAGCADRTATRPAPEQEPASRVVPSPASSSDAGPHAERRSTDRPRSVTRPRSNAETSPPPSSDQSLPESTGIPTCDDYLASYRACHRAAQIYAPETIESHYETMRQSLLRDSLKPDIRPQLSNRCNALANSLRNALHGKSCMP